MFIFWETGLTKFANIIHENIIQAKIINKQINKHSSTYCQLRPVMNPSDVAEVEELSVPEFTHHADSAGFSTSDVFRCFSRK